MHVVEQIVSAFSDLRSLPGRPSGLGSSRMTRSGHLQHLKLRHSG